MAVRQPQYFLILSSKKESEVVLIAYNSSMNSMNVSRLSKKVLQNRPSKSQLKIYLQLRELQESRNNLQTSLERFIETLAKMELSTSKAPAVMKPLIPLLIVSDLQIQSTFRHIWRMTQTMERLLKKRSITNQQSSSRKTKSRK